MDVNIERRRFSRVLFHTPVALHQGEQAWQCQLLDISLHGLSVSKPKHWPAASSAPLHASIQLADDTLIHMRVCLARQSSRQLGFACEDIDLDSIGLLRRLLELNLGDAATLQRDLSELASLRPPDGIVN
ncbi:PilZ domain-containing protein [Pseudomaricurvus alcaniphilus]|uniref:PilZ domain-containing protein n=1 Tax=Pseudomaricurvus alcaniphilus TaxID=1166482 RepID=UPI001A9DF656|nr:PilZ domain-containing protein [Pseudomaricurvus alcaniphilus]